MKKLFVIAYLIVCVNIATTLLPSQVKTPVEQLVRIMMSNIKDQNHYNLAKNRNPNDYQDVYTLVTKHPKLLKGIIHDGRTFAMLCVQRGYADLLERLINEDYCIDLATPCNLCGLHEPQDTVLHVLLGQVWQVRKFKECYSEDYIVRITALTKLIINKYPDLLDIKLDRTRTARNKAIERDLYDLIPCNLPQSANTITTTLESELLNACKVGDLATVQKLVKQPDVDVNKGDEYGITPLLAACQNRSCQMVEKLLAVPGIDVNQADNNGETPLLVACKNNGCNLNLDIIDALLKNGAVNKANNKGETPLEITKDTLISGVLEAYLVGEVRASKWCNALSTEDCKDMKRKNV